MSTSQTPKPKRQDRLSAAGKAPLNPQSLVGTFFHGTSAQGWQGCVVAEPAPGIYLVELFSWVMGDSTHQQLVRMYEMTGWRFYDDAEWMNNDYEAVVSRSNGSATARARKPGSDGRSGWHRCAAPFSRGDRWRENS